MIKNNKGSALLQVLVLGALISTIVVVLLRFSSTRTANMVQTKNLVGSNIAVQSCYNLLSEEDARRIEIGKVPYLTEKSTFYCSIDGYNITIIQPGASANNLNVIIRPSR
jgi:hypothetical protein